MPDTSLSISKWKISLCRTGCESSRGINNGVLEGCNRDEILLLSNLCYVLLQMIPHIIPIGILSSEKVRGEYYQRASISSKAEKH